AAIHDVPLVVEQTLWKGTPSPIVLLGPGLELLVALIAIPTAAHFAAKNSNPENAANILPWGWWITAVAVLYFAIRMLVAYGRIRSTLYTITNQRVMIERGLLSKSLSEIDLRYIDETQFQQSALERMLGIGNVTIISSDKSLPAYTLRGIKDPRAVRETIRTAAYQASQRQLFTRAT
ncbi:MAG: hypothetical protein JWO56_1308, partial [Acidobacteria bacterium]|nr:hypothetical protein [Acidobacteriota bacterium]